MSRWMHVSLAIMMAVALLPAMSVQAQTDPACDISGVQPNGALYCITLPHDNPNGGLVIFAHGYVAATEPLAIPWSQMMFVNDAGNTIYMPDVINDLGFVFATTSYRENGLAVQQGVADILELVLVVTQLNQGVPPSFVLLVGASEGGLVTTLAVERYPEVFAGGLAACGPIGSFTGQVNYWGDFRVLFDYFMDLPRHDILPGSAVVIPEELMNNWDSIYMPRVLASLILRPLATKQLMSVSKAPYDLADRTTIAETSLGILWYNVFATNDAVAKLGGNPFDNHDRKYSGSYADYWLNRRVARFTADPAALAAITNYETSGMLMRPLVTMHTTGDPIVPAWHQSLYAQKVLANNPQPPFTPVEITRYGHCTFTLTEIQQGFAQLAAMVLSGPLMQATPMTTPETGEAQPVEETYYYDYH